MKYYDIKLCFLVYFIFSVNVIQGQQENMLLKAAESESKIAIGGSIGMNKNLVNTHLGFYFSPGLFVEFPVAKRWKLIGGVEYFQTSYEYEYQRFRYKGTEYYGMFGETWENYSLKLGISYRISNRSDIGVITMVEKIQLKQIKPENQEFRPAFTVDPYTDEVNYFSETISDELVVPALAFFASMDILKVSNIIPFVMIRYKLQFVGNKYGETPLNTQNSFLIGAGVKYNF